MTEYLGVIHEARTGNYSVSFPDFPGCITQGETMEQARLMAKEALEFYIEDMIEDGDPIPPPSTLDQIGADPENAGVLVISVPVVIAKTKSVRISITVEERLLSELDGAAGARSMTRSGFIAEAARRMIHADR